MSKKDYCSNLDLTLIHYFRALITDNVDLLVNEQYYLQLCAASDRIEEIAIGLNNKTLTYENNQSAYCYCEYISQAYVMMNCLKTLSTIINSTQCDNKKEYMSKIETTNIIGNLGINNDGNDWEFVCYLRALSSEHPTETSKHKKYSTVAEYSPFVTWSSSQEGLLSVTKYDANGNISLMDVDINKLIKYTNHVYSQLSWMDKSLI